MHLRADRIRFATCLACGLCFCTPLFAQTDVRSSGPQAATAKTAFIAATGAVEKSGVFELDQPNPTLESVLQVVGGLSVESTGNIRIVRDGRETLNTHVTKGAVLRLQSGDVVFAAGVGPLAQNRKRNLVELAIVGLIERPVVVRVQPEHAELRTVVAMLGQDSAAGAAVRVIGGTGNRTTDGAIVVFDPRTVNRDRIPELPPTNRPRDAAGVRPERVETNRDATDQLRQVAGLLQSARADLAAGKFDSARDKAHRAGRFNVDLRKLSDRPEWILADVAKHSANEQLRKPQTDGHPMLIPTAANRYSLWLADDDPDGESGVVQAGGPEFDEPGPFQPGGLRDASEPASGVPNSAPAQTPAAPVADGSTVNADSRPVEIATESPGKVDEESTSAFDLVALIIGLFVGLVVLGAGASLWMVHLRRAAERPDSTQSKTQTKSIPERPAATLDLLIRNELEVHEESVAAPRGAVFFGRTQGLQRNRIDEPHAGPHRRPHFETNVFDAAAVEAGSAAPPASRPLRVRIKGSPSTTTGRSTALRADAPEAAPPQPSGHPGEQVGGRTPSRTEQEERA